MVGPRPPSGCWSCGALPTVEDLRLLAMLHPRSASEGGPWTRLACPSCGLETVVEEVPGGDPVLAPPTAAGTEVPAFAAFLDGKEALGARRRARAWMERWAAALERLREERAASPRREAPPPRRPPPPPRPAPPPRGRGRRGREATPPTVPAGDLPRTPAEARAVLGVAEGASSKEIDAAFRKASRRCHPDLVSHLDEDFQRLAHGKFLRLKAAQDLLRGGTGRRPAGPSSNAEDP